MFGGSNTQKVFGCSGIEARLNYHVSFHYSSGCMNPLRWYQLTKRSWYHGSREKMREDSCITKGQGCVFGSFLLDTTKLVDGILWGCSELPPSEKSQEIWGLKGTYFSHHGKVVTEFRKVAGQTIFAKSLGANLLVKKKVVIYETPSIFFSWMWGFSGVGIGSLWYGCFLKLQHPKKSINLKKIRKESTIWLASQTSTNIHKTVTTNRPKRPSSLASEAYPWDFTLPMPPQEVSRKASKLWYLIILTNKKLYLNVNIDGLPIPILAGFCPGSL